MIRLTNNRRPDFTEEQIDWLICLVDDWYLYWKENMTGEANKHPRPPHKLGRAKEQLKEIICRGAHGVGPTLIDFLEGMMEGNDEE